MDEMMIQPKGKKKWIIIAIAAVVVLAGIAFWYFNRKKPILTPEQTLQQLQSSSQPVTASPEERADALSAAHDSSIQYVVTPQQQLDTLNALKK